MNGGLLDFLDLLAVFIPFLLNDIAFLIPPGLEAVFLAVFAGDFHLLLPVLFPSDLGAVFPPILEGDFFLLLTVLMPVGLEAMFRAVLMIDF